MRDLKLSPTKNEMPMLTEKQNKKLSLLTVEEIYKKIQPKIQSKFNDLVIQNRLSMNFLNSYQRTKKSTQHKSIRVLTACIGVFREDYSAN